MSKQRRKLKAMQTTDSPSPDRRGRHLPRIRRESPNERRRFVTVVRPSSVFPDPPLPPNFFRSPNNSPFNDDSRAAAAAATTGGRPPSPAPFGRRMAGPMSLNGVPLRHDARLPHRSMRINLAGASGWDLTAIRRGYNVVPPLNNPLR